MSLSRRPVPPALLALLALLPLGCVHPAPARSVATEAARCGGSLPDPLRPPPGHRVALETTATGVQIYACQLAPDGGAAWTFTAPEATLRDLGGAPAGRHYAGPTWEAPDGSAVVGAKVAGASPDGAAIPWLLLSAKEHRGAGQLAGVTYIQRIATSGGLAPASGCTAAAAGAEARVPYTATYCFVIAE